MPSSWSECLEKGERLYNHLLQHYEEMIGGQMAHFDIYYTCYHTACDYERIGELYRDKIREAIRPWIEEEHQSGRLFDREQWKPFRDILTYTSMYYGYRPLFVFDGILYFQLTIKDQLVEEPDGTFVRYIMFDAALYGWKGEGEEGVTPNGQVIADGRMTEWDWTRN